MTIVLTGGGSGGHITPLLVVASELKRQQSDSRLVYIGQKGDRFVQMAASDPNIDEVFTVRAGKFRRYNSEGLKQLLDVVTILKNIRDVAYILIGLVQSYFIIKKLKPDIVFSRGGYVSVPVCIGAMMRGVRYITHDSDPIPSLTNKIIGRWANLHLVAQAKSLYPYPESKTITTGVPVNRSFVRVTAKVRQEYRQKLNIKSTEKLVFIIGGGLGARSLNEAVAEILPNILSEFNDLRVVHVVGHKNEDAAIKTYDGILDNPQRQRVKILAFTNEVYMYSGAADLVVTRAGATNLAEFELQGVACIVIPSTYLTGGHQLKNAKILEEKHAVKVITDKELELNPHILAKEISWLLNNPNECQMLAKELSKLAHPRADEEIARIIIKTAEAS
ncbi:MAG: UDP-N-acetylglucosamine--N-acetylmuramyl-(pentapeptide) pyrophosphoryl-undecaprenol N-acetylglucosamine transferase [Candidatus Saccharimonadales bacterium]